MNTEYIQKRLEINKKREEDIAEGYKQAELYYHWKKQQLDNIHLEVKRLELLLENLNNNNNNQETPN